MNRNALRFSGYAPGFTLIEILIVMALIGIIAAIAIPSYSNGVMKSKRQIGKAELMKVISRQEQFFVNNKSYATDLTNLGYSTNPYFIDDQGNEIAAGTSIYQVSLIAPTATGFSVRVTPQNAQTSDTQCASMEITSTGQKSIVGGAGTVATCW